MYESLQPAKPDAILALIGLFKEDNRPNKLDLGVGVYKDEHGATPIMQTVRDAERRLYDEQDSKAYLGMAGDAAFNAAMLELTFGASADMTRLRAVQAPGGSGALRLVAELVRRARPAATVWISDPTWPNHVPLIEATGLKTRPYPYFDAASGTVRFDAMMEALAQAAAGDVVLLHGCCHNPTGANLDLAQWQAVTDLLVERGLFPFVDLAYQGFGDGLDEDAAGLRLLASRVPELAAAVSCSKNFSVYRDRVGSAMVLGRTPEEATIAAGQIMSIARGMYSMPPDHGAAAVRIVLKDDALKTAWKADLERTRLRMLALREGLAEALRRHSNSNRFDFIARHRGMFSRIGLTPEQVERLRTEYAVYMVGDSRINVAGLREDSLDRLAQAIVAVTR